MSDTSKATRFDITEADVGRYVRRVSTGEVSKISRDHGNGWLHPGSIYYEWQAIRDDLEYVSVMPAGTHDALVEALREAERQIEYLHEKFKPTGTGEATLAKIRAALALAERT